VRVGSVGVAGQFAWPFSSVKSWPSIKDSLSNLDMHGRRHEWLYG
jgi:hypothetical protein